MTRKHTIVLVLGFVFASVVLPAQEEKKPYVVTTLTDLAAIAKEVGGDLIEVEALARGDEDPHFVLPKPSLVAKSNKADLFVQIGMELEVWAESVLDGAANPKIRPGQAGHVYACKGVDVLEKPRVMSRTEGDVHPEGNPHIMLDPLNALTVAENIANGLKRIAPAHADEFDENLKTFKEKTYRKLYGKTLVKMLGGKVLASLDRGGRLMKFLKEKTYKGKKLVEYLGGWHKAMLPHRGKKIVTHHRLWSYFVHRFGLTIASELEPKPGIPPSAAHLLEVVKVMKKEDVSLILVAPYYSRKAADLVATKTGADVVVCPTAVGGDKGVDDYFSLLDTIVERTTKAWETTEKGGAEGE